MSVFTGMFKHLQVFESSALQVLTETTGATSPSGFPAKSTWAVTGAIDAFKVPLTGEEMQAFNSLRGARERLQAFTASNPALKVGGRVRASGQDYTIESVQDWEGEFVQLILVRETGGPK